MAKVKGNKIVPIIVILLVIGGIFIFIKNKSNNNKNSEANTEVTQQVADLNDEDLELLGINGDTEKDTVQTLITLVKGVRKQQEESNAEIKKLKSDNERLKKGNFDTSETQYKIKPHETKENNVLQQTVSELSDKIKSLSDKYSSIGTNQQQSQQETSNYPTTNGGLPIGKGQIGGEETPVDEISWIMPSDQIEKNDERKSDKGFSFPTSFNGNDPIRSKLKAHKDNINQPIGDKDEKTKDNVYTIAANATLMGSVSMTALLGRVPVDGVVNDPYPFKAIIGRDNLIANGIELPHVEGAIVSGTTSGDFVLSCVKGTVKSITFVFDDGRIRTIPDAKNGSSSDKDAIGWISDEYGIPCVSGELKTNAQEYLSTIATLSSLGAAADAISQANTTVATNSNGDTTTIVNGDMSKYALGKGLSGGLQTTVEWFNKRYGQTFDAVYVAPGKEIAIHINKELDIDYYYNARLVDYGKNTHTLGVLD